MEEWEDQLEKRIAKLEHEIPHGNTEWKHLKFAAVENAKIAQFMGKALFERLDKSLANQKATGDAMIEAQRMNAEALVGELKSFKEKSDSQAFRLVIATWALAIVTCILAWVTYKAESTKEHVVEPVKATEPVKK